LAGIVPPDRAKKVVDRLMAPDMWTGWGIRTLSANHPAYNPYNYQTGSVWPHDNAIILLDAPRNKLYIDPSLPVWLPDLAVQDLRVGKHKLDIRFWREGEQTAFEVIRGDPGLVERCDIVSKVARLRTASDPI